MASERLQSSYYKMIIVIVSCYDYPSSEAGIFLSVDYIVFVMWLEEITRKALSLRRYIRSDTNKVSCQVSSWQKVQKRRLGREYVDSYIIFGLGWCEPCCFSLGMVTALNSHQTLIKIGFLCEEEFLSRYLTL